MAGATIIARRSELEAVDVFLDAVAERPAGLLLEGEAGIGKTRVWAEAVARSRARGVRVVATRPAAAEAKLAFAALADLAEPLLDGDVSLPDPQRLALDAALLRTVTHGRIDRRAVAAAFLATVRAAAQHGPVVIAVDDVQWLDAPTADALAFALRRLDSEPVGLLATVRVAPGEPYPDELRRAVGAEQLQRVPLDGLSVGALYELIRTRIGARLSRPTLLRLHETSRGNPFFALELARALVESGVEPTLDEPLPVPRELTKLLRDRLARLPRRADEALLYAAALSQPTVSVVEALFPRAAAALRDAADAAVVEIDGDAIRFTHPLLASTRYAAATMTERRRVHSAVAASVSDPEERAMHLALAADGPDETVAAALHAAARRAGGRGALAAAADLAAKAVGLTQRSRRARLHDRRLDAARYAFACGRSAVAAAQLEAALAAAAPGRARAAALFELAELRAHTHDKRVAFDFLNAAAAEVGDDAALGAAIHDRLADIGSYWGGGATAGLRHARRAVQLAEAAADKRMLTRALTTLAELEGWSAKAADRTFERAEAFERELREPPRPGGATHTHALSQRYAGELDAARDRLMRVVEAARTTGDVGVADALLSLSWVEFEAGNWAEAADLIHEAHLLAEQSGRDVVDAGTIFALANLEAATGDVDRGRKRALEALEMTERTGRLSRGPRGVLGLIELSVERYDAAYGYLAPAVERNRARGFHDPSQLTILTVDALAGLGRTDEARSLLGPYERVACRLRRRLPVAAAARSRGVIAASEGDLETAVSHLAHAGAAFAALPLPLELGRTLLVLGEVQRRLRRKSEARETLTRALAVFEELGARIWADRARRELARIGGRAAAADGLSETQERIAALVRAGRTNREVAAELHLSPHTVEWNLSRIYRKLGVRSRTELAANARR